MDKREFKYLIQVSTNHGWETLAITTELFYPPIVGDLESCRKNERFRVILDRTPYKTVYQTT